MVGPIRHGARGRAGGSGPGTKFCLELVAAAACDVSGAGPDRRRLNLPGGITNAAVEVSTPHLGNTLYVLGYG
jgi:hypothetical protein